MMASPPLVLHSIVPPGVNRAFIESRLPTRGRDALYLGTSYLLLESLEAASRDSPNLPCSLRWISSESL